MIVIGVALGTAAALAAGRILQRLVEGMQPVEILLCLSRFLHS